MQAHNLSARVMSPEVQVFQVPKTDTSMLGGPVHTSAACDHGDQSDGIFDPGHQNLPGFEAKLF